MGQARAGVSTDALALAASVHDGPLQLLAVAVQELVGEPADVPRAEQLVRRAMAELHGLLQAPPLTVAVVDMRETFSWWADLVLAPGMSWQLDGPDGLERLSFFAYEMARELLTNAGRHSQGRHVHVLVQADGAGELVVVEDDGVGMAADWQPGYGLAAMYSRVQAAGGTIDHRPRRPKGTRVTLRVPSRHPIAPG